MSGKNRQYRELTDKLGIEVHRQLRDVLLSATSFQFTAYHLAFTAGYLQSFVSVAFWAEGCSDTSIQQRHLKHLCDGAFPGRLWDIYQRGQALFQLAKDGDRPEFIETIRNRDAGIEAGKRDAVQLLHQHDQPHNLARYLLGHALGDQFAGGNLATADEQTNGIWHATHPILERADRMRDPASLSMPTRVNYVAAHWRGDHSLTRAFWVNGVLLQLATIQFLAWLTPGNATRDMGPHIIGTVMLLVVFGWLTLSAWQAVGIWRSADKHRSTGGRAIHSILARISVAIAFVFVVKLIAIFAPMFPEWTKLAVGIDDVGSYELRLLSNNTELELYGSIPYGTADAVAEKLKAFPSVASIRLESDGGRITEAQRLADLIRDHRLATHTTELCASACIFPFLAGTRRLLGSEAKIGLHGAYLGSFQEASLPGLGTDLQEALEENGTSPALAQSFAERASATPPSDLWYPSTQELLDAHIITEVVGEDL